MGPGDTAVTKKGLVPFSVERKHLPLSNPDRGQNSALCGETIGRVGTCSLPNFPERVRLHCWEETHSEAHVITPQTVKPNSYSSCAMTA